MEKEREGEVGRREVEKKRGRRGGEMRGIIALFLIINVLMISCGNAGPIPKEGQAATADGKIIDLAKVSEKIKDVSTFVVDVKEIETLVKSIIDGISKGIKQKIGTNGLEDDSGGSAHHTPLLAGVYKVAEIILQKSKALKVTDSIKDLGEQVKAIVAGAEGFINKLKASKNELGVASGAATDTDAKKAIVIGNSDESKGASELKALNIAVNELLTAANRLVSDTLGKLTTSVNK